MQKSTILSLLAVACLMQCSITEKTVQPSGTLSDKKAGIRYLALGDSYTIGESVDADRRFPAQLADELKRKDFDVQEVKVIARTGWTTDDLQGAIATEELPEDRYQFVSLLIGVNNQFRGYPIEQFEREFAELLAESIRFAGGKPDRVFVLSIPDYGVTPYARSRNPERIALEIDQYNAIKKDICEQAGASFIEITEISRKALDEPALIASDRLHPSAEMYARWVEKLLPEVLEAF